VHEEEEGMRRGWFVFVPLFVLLSGAAAAASPAGSPVEAFVQQSIDRGIGILKDTSLSDEARREQLGRFMAEVLDTKRMALFMLGEAQAKAAPADLDAYAEAYKAFSIARYQSQLDGYGGQTLKVTGSQERAPGDYIVDAVVVDPAAPNDPSPLPVSFRVEDEHGKFAVVDAGIMGIWLGLAQRDDFGGYLSQHADSVPALTAHLRDVTSQLTGPTATDAAR
jgi:phospholipid transport system substrate-binding protein